nr:hypothetical protein BaRGS_032005 [Batillaria attramentaria]
MLRVQQSPFALQGSLACTIWSTFTDKHSLEESTEVITDYLKFFPSLWKTAAITPVPKNNRPVQLNDYRPIALTPIVMKCLERLILARLTNETQDLFDPLQFAYRRGRSVEDAVITLLHDTVTHLEQPKSYARILYVDFSSAFNTIQPHLMVQKLDNMHVNPNIILWTTAKDPLLEKAEKNALTYVTGYLVKKISDKVWIK